MSAHVSERVAATFATAGGEVVAPALLQPANAYVDLAGEDVRARLVRIAEVDGEELCLRPDLTIPVCRLHADRRRAGFAGPAVYRYDELVYRFAGADDRRPIETRQIGLERFGDADVLDADVEVFAIAASAVRAAGGEGERIVVGDAGLFARFVDGVGLGVGLGERLKRAFQTPQGFTELIARSRRPSALAAALAKVSPDAAAAALTEVYDLAGVEAVGARRPAAIAERLLDEAAEARFASAAPEAVAAAERLASIDAPLDTALDQVGEVARSVGVDLGAWLDAWSQRAARLTEIVAGAPLRFSVGMARQFDYYDGFVFELRDPGVEDAKFLAAGGRYDGLIERLGLGAREPSVGCVVRPLALARSAGRAS